MDYILAFDVGTTSLKAGVFTPDLDRVATAARTYDVNLYDRVKADIHPEIWWKALVETCSEFGELLRSVRIITFSVTTPGLVPMAEDGSALGPAILFLDGRSHKQARQIRERVGEGFFLRETCNLPVSGGSSLCSILWIKENQPEVWDATSRFGHCNTFMVKRLTGEWAIDPSTVSITGMYNTTRNDLTWSDQVLKSAGIPLGKLPPLIPSHCRVGEVLPDVANQLGLRRGTIVLCGGNDAVLGALSAGIVNPGDTSMIHGTCDVTEVCVDHPIRSKAFNVRCHVVPNRWLSFFVLNTGGKALEWFHSVFCSELDRSEFFGSYVPGVLDSFFASQRPDLIEETLPTYEPYLQGSRYSLEQRTASLSNITLQTSRDLFLLGLIKGNLSYSASHLREIQSHVKLSGRIATSGGAATIPGFVQAQRRWIGAFEFELTEQSSLLGAAMLAQMHQENGAG